MGYLFANPQSSSLAIFKGQPCNRDPFFKAVVSFTSSTTERSNMFKMPHSVVFQVRIFRWRRACSKFVLISKATLTYKLGYLLTNHQWFQWGSIWRGLNLILQNLNQMYLFKSHVIEHCILQLACIVFGFMLNSCGHFMELGYDTNSSGLL